MFSFLLRFTSAFLSFVFISFPTLAEQSIHLAPGDRLSFWIVGTLDTPREIPIQPDGIVMLPLAGALDVNGLTIAQARQSLASQLQKNPLRLTTPEGIERRIGLKSNEVGLDVAQFRPVYVSGDVNTVGEIDYRPNLTARQAIAKSNGVLRMFQAFDSELPIGMLSHRASLVERVKSSELALHLLLEHYKLLNPGTDLRTDPMLSRVLDKVDYVGDTNQVSLQSRLLELEELRRNNTVRQLEARIEVVTRLEETNKETMRIAEATVARLSGLAEQGLLRTDAMDNARQNLLQAQARSFEAASERLRLGLEVTQMQDSEVFNNLQTASEILAEIENELTQFEVAKSQLEVLNKGTRQLGISEYSTQDQNVELTLFRRINDETIRSKIEFDDLLLPGDVLNVSRQ